ncbi:unnamed protein product [Arctia plantaginis]|uniref:ABC transporter domain-containing protein n=1 Tax=Arctia plantaginis TaxID=874455 RepID=A0A8S1AXQ4_ARCPL|nr:unnamed protein product [Arctia plantaginis]
MFKVHRHDRNSVNKIIFSPRNNMTEKIMENVINELNWIDLASGLSSDSLEFDFYNATAFLGDSSDIITMVNFEDAGSQTNNFTYSIRTLVQGPRYELEEPFREFFYDLQHAESYVTPSLGWLQWAIDKSYIEYIGNRSVLKKLQFRYRTNFIPDYVQVIQSFINMCMVLAPLPFFLYKASKFSYAKGNGFQNLMRLAGVSYNVYRISHLLFTVVTSSIYATIIAGILKWSSHPILPYSNPVIIYISIVLYFLNVNSLAFVTSTISSDYHYNNSLAMLVYIITFLVGFKWFTQKMTTETTRIIVCCLLPHSPIFMFWDNVIYLENLGKGVTFSEINKMHGYHLPVTVIWLVLLLHIVWLLILDWYLDHVIPSKFGVTRKWTFIFKRKMLSSKRRKSVNFHVTAEQNVRVLRDSRYFEDLPSHAEIAVKVTKLTKIYKSKSGGVVALDKVSLDVFRGEVTVLLGNRGAGKSTLMGIISGMQAPSSGKVYINGMDNVLRLSEVMDNVSFCPKQIVLYRYLTVRENITFFEKLKKFQEKSIVDDLITQLQMTEYENLLRDQLPRGLRRCLQVACCIASGAEILVFDEPTHKMGIEAKHRVWDLIMKLRGRKTVIMSTPILEEASALGDRIVILNKGKVRCFGSPSFLSNAIGIGLNLTIRLHEPTYLEDVQNLVELAIPNVKSQVYGSRSVTFMLPQKERDSFINLIDTLEQKKRDLGITTMDVGVSMQAVYLEFIDQFNDEDVILEAQYEDAIMEKRKDWRVVRTQFLILIKRVYHYVWMKKYQFTMMQVILPIIILFLVTLTTNRKYGYSKFGPLKSDVDTLVFDLGPYKRNAVNDVVDKYGVYPLFSKNVEKDLDLLPVSPEKTVGLKMSRTTTKMFLPDDPYALTKSVNMFSNLYLNIHMPKANKTIITRYKPINKLNNVVEPKPVFLCVIWAVWVSFCSMLTLAPFIMLAIMERKTGTRDIHIMAGCSALVHWSSKLIAYMSIYLAIVPISVLLTALCFDFDNTFNHLEFLGVLFLILIVFAIAFLAHLQFLSFILHDYVAIGQIYFMSFGFGIIVPVFLTALEFQGIENEAIRITFIIMMVLVYISPLFVFTDSLFQLVLLARLNTYCVLNKHLCPNLIVNNENFSSKICCDSSSKVPYSYFDATSTINIIVLVMHVFLYMTIVILLQKRIIQYWIERILFYKYKPPQQRYFNNGVEMEKAVVRDRYLIKQFSNEVLMAHKLYKTFYRCMKKLQADDAIQGITFLAKKGECIGVLGPTGAGKSTLLRLLAGCLPMTRGDSWVAGYNIRADRNKYLRKVGLVTTTGQLDRFYTGYENLVLICQLAGYSKIAAERLSTLLLQDLGLNSYANTLVDKYNHSCWQRLLLCVVYVLDPAVAFIDEPMVNVEHGTRSIIARAIRKIVASGTTCIVAESSLDWYQMESVYNRLAILYGGQFAAIGQASDVVGNLTTGYSVHIKLKVPKAYWCSQASLAESLTEANIDIDRANEIQALKDDFKTEFVSSVVAQENVCMLFFYIENEELALSYNELYSKLHKLIDKHKNIMESYTFNKTTIEEVFWRIPYLIDHFT